MKKFGDNSGSFDGKSNPVGINELIVKMKVRNPNKVMRKIWDILFYLLQKIDNQRLKSCTIGEEFKIEWETFVNDDEWHHMGFTVDAWVKINNKTVKNESVFVDGEKK